MTRYLFTFGLVLLAALSRLVPHPVNVAPITALALFGGVYLDKKHTFIVPLGAMLIAAATNSWVGYVIAFVAAVFASANVVVWCISIHVTSPMKERVSQRLPST